jgi:hypothetical protein
MKVRIKVVVEHDDGTIKVNDTYKVKFPGKDGYDCSLTTVADEVEPLMAETLLSVGVAAEALLAVLDVLPEQ